MAGFWKDFPIRISGFRPLAEAIVTSGGVSLKEVDPRTMESKLVKASILQENCWTSTPIPAATTCRSPFPPDTWQAAFCKIFEAAGRFCLRCGLS